MNRHKVKVGSTHSGYIKHEKVWSLQEGVLLLKDFTRVKACNATVFSFFESPIPELHLQHCNFKIALWQAFYFPIRHTLAVRAEHELYVLQ